MELRHLRYFRAVAAEQARRIADGAEGRLAIGCVGSATYSLLPQLVRAVSEALPGVDVSVRGEMLAPAQITALRAGQIDLALLRPPVEHRGRARDAAPRPAAGGPARCPSAGVP